MAFKNIPLTIDTMIRNPEPIEGINQEDNVELNIVVTENKTPKDLSGQTIKVYVRRIDGTLVEQTNQITPTNARKGEVTVKLKNSAFNKEGYALFQLDVSDSSGRITSSYATFKIGKGLVSGEAIANTNEIEALKKVEEYIKKANQELETFKQTVTEINENEATRQENEVVRVKGEASRNKAEAIRVQQEATRKEKENERVRLESIRTTEEADRLKSEVERKEAENNRKVAESNRKLAENTRKTNEAARVEAELNRQSLFEENEEIRNSNENLRIASEKERIKFNSEAKTDELNRKEAEKNRVLAEEERKSSEESRVASEAIRQNTYTDFNDSEVERKNNEANRVRAEAERVNAESGRNELFNTNEEKRNSTFIESERTRERAFNEAQSNRNEAYEESERVREEAFKVSEAARNEAEEGRVAAELLRVEAEMLRVAGEENRNTTFTQSEEERKTTFEEAENVRKVAESKRVAAETGRGEAEKLRVTAETERVEAENLRVTAEEERVAAEAKREEGFNKFESRINANTEELKNARTATTGEKFNTLDERIDCEVDRLNKKIEVSFLQQEDKENHVIENTVDGMTTDMIVKGKTLYKKSDGSHTNILEENVTLESFGQQEDKISILSHGKNLLNINNFTDDKFLNYNDGSIQELREGRCITEKFYKLPQNIVLSSSENLWKGFWIYDSNFNFIRNVENPNDVHVTRQSNEKYYRIGIQELRESILSKKVQLEEGTIKTTYEPYKEDKKDILLSELGFDEGLRGIKNITDELNSIRSVAIKKIGKREYREGDLLLDSVITDKVNTYYVLEEPIETPLDENINLKTFGEKTYVSFENAINGTSSFKVPVNTVATISSLNRENRALKEENKNLKQDFESTTLSLADSDLELVKQNVDMDFRLMEVEFALDIPQSTLSSNINFKSKKGEVKSMARTPYEMMKIVILSGDYDREDYMYKVGKYYERGRMTKEEHDELMSLMTADEVIGG